MTMLIYKDISWEQKKKREINKLKIIKINKIFNKKFNRKQEIWFKFIKNKVNFKNLLKRTP